MKIVIYYMTLGLIWFFVIGSLISCGKDDYIDSKYDWTWSADTINVFGDYMGQYLSFVSYDIGCSDLHKIYASSGKAQFSCGYKIINSLPDHFKHYDAQNRVDIDDGFFDGFSFTGVILAIFATQEQLDLDAIEPGVPSTSHISNMSLYVKTSDEIKRPEEVFFSNISLKYENLECPDYVEICWRELNPIFVICWDNARTGRRAYQLIYLWLPTKGDNYNKAICGGSLIHPIYGEVVQRLGVYWGLLDQYVYTPLPYSGSFGIKNMADFIDKALPRPTH